MNKKLTESTRATLEQLRRKKNRIKKTYPPDLSFCPKFQLNACITHLITRLYCERYDQSFRLYVVSFKEDVVTALYVFIINLITTLYSYIIV